MRVLVGVCLLLAASAWSATLPMTLTSYGSFDDSLIEVDIVDNGCSLLSASLKCVDISVEILNAATYGGDITGIFLGLPGYESLEHALVASNVAVAVTPLDAWSFMNPVPVPGGFEFGFGTDATGPSQTLTSVTLRVGASDLVMQDFMSIGVRIQSVGYFGDRGDSGKYYGTFTWQDDPGVPEPSTFFLAGGAILGLSLLRRRK